MQKAVFQLILALLHFYFYFYFAAFLISCLICILHKLFIYQKCSSQ